MNLSNNPVKGAHYLLRGAKLITKPGLRKFVILPLLINIVFFIVLGYFAFGWVSELSVSMLDSLPESLQWLDSVVSVLIAIILAVLTFFTFAIVASIISSPFNGPLAAAVEAKFNTDSVNQDGPWHAVISELPGVLKDEVEKVFYAVTRSIPFLVLFIVPVVNIVASALWVIFGTWLLALQFADYPLGNHNVRFKQQRQTLKQRRLLVMGFGGAVMAAMLIPIVNLFVVPCAVAGATLMILEQFPKQTDAAQDHLAN